MSFNLQTFGHSNGTDIRFLLPESLTYCETPCWWCAEPTELHPLSKCSDSSGSLGPTQLSIFLHALSRSSDSTGRFTLPSWYICKIYIYPGWVNWFEEIFYLNIPMGKYQGKYIPYRVGRFLTPSECRQGLYGNSVWSIHSIQGRLRTLLVPRGEKKPMWAMRLFKLMPWILSKTFLSQPCYFNVACLLHVTQTKDMQIVRS